MSPMRGVVRLRAWQKMMVVEISLTTAVTMAASVCATELSPVQIYAGAAPAVVFIRTSMPDGSGGSGTGSIIDARGVILTNAHVVLDKKTKAPKEIIEVFLKPDRPIGDEDNLDNLTERYPATVLGYDDPLDVALLKITPPASPLPVLQLADPARVTIGARVHAIGHPEQGGLWSLTTGVISAEWKNFQNIPGKDIFQTETSINRGNSGGPLIDGQGHQIGINSLAARQSPVDGLTITSINFALKTSVVKNWLARQGVPVDYAKVDQSAETPLGRAVPKQKQPDKILENQPEAKPETGAGLPPLRPYSIDNLLKRLDLVQKDLEKQMDDMGAEIEKRRRR